MAVKKHELAPENRSQLDLATLVEYILLLNEQPAYLPPPSELIKHCQDIVKCLARTEATDNDPEIRDQLQLVEEFYISLVSSVSVALRQEIITAVLDKFHSILSDPQSDACPAMSIVLIVFDGSPTTEMVSAAAWLVQKSENGPAGGAGLRASLACLLRWTYQWYGTPALGDWILAFIKALEERESYEILREVAMDNIESLFLALKSPGQLKQSIADVIFRVMSCMRENIEVLDRVSPHVGNVLVTLAAESSQWSRQLLQNVVDLLTVYVDNVERNMLRDKYADVIMCLDKHMSTSSTARYIQMPCWGRTTRSSARQETSSPPRIHKVGLANLGNTCYMNSVMQALLVTRQFSTGVVTRMTAAPYWEKVGLLFAKMMHSIASKLNPADILETVKPPFFTTETQHDSSEFLVYLFELLKTYENVSARNFDYKRPSPPNRMRLIALPPSEGENNNESSSNRRSMSPRPSGSETPPRPGGSNGTKRSSPCRSADILMPPKKRARNSDMLTSVRQNSFIDHLFGGVLLTRVECTGCHFSSLSRDVFRDLQLAFPEKPEPGKQHSVQSLLEYYCSKERLSGENKYRCPDCGELKDAEKSVIIESPPKYLILILKNFRFEPKQQQQTKLMQNVHYNHMVTLPTLRSQADHANYSVYAAVIHSGTTLDSGHYYTLAKDNDKWHMYNDEIVEESHETEINRLPKTCTPYVLFYRRTDIEEAAPPSLQELPDKLLELVTGHNKHYFDSINNINVTRP